MTTFGLLSPSAFSTKATLRPAGRKSSITNLVTVQALPASAVAAEVPATWPAAEASASISNYSSSSRSSNSSTRSKDTLQAGATAATPNMPDWALRFLRQVPSLPQGRGALEGLLMSTNCLLLAAVGSEHRLVVEAYCMLALVDIVSAAWTQQATYLKMVEAATGPSQYCEQHLQQASFALCGCRYLRLEAVTRLADAMHTALDGKGHNASLNLSALPKATELGLNMTHLLIHGLAVDDLATPQLRDQQCFQCQSWDEYCSVSADASLCGEWEFAFWGGGASFVPAPYPKFSTAELADVLQPVVILSSLEGGVWGCGLLAAAQQAGLHVEAWTQPESVVPAVSTTAAASSTSTSTTGATASSSIDALRRALVLANRGGSGEAVDLLVSGMQQAVLATSASVAVAATRLRQNVDRVLGQGAAAGGGDAAGSAGVSAKPVVARR